MKKTVNFLSCQQDDFERTAYAYGVQPAVCALLAEVFYQKLREAWQNGHRSGWIQAVGKMSNNLLPAAVNNS
ncbi:MAG: hypothetical protein V1664_04960 [Candidatus Uhrbacteria bacterium]